jgi:ATP-dependent DNA ligase
MAFDLLRCDGEDLRYLPVTERKRRPRDAESWADIGTLGSTAYVQPPTAAVTQLLNICN